MDDKVINKQLEDYCAWNLPGSASFRAAKEIFQHLKNSSPPNHCHAPRALLSLRDEISFRRAMRRNPLHHNFNYREGFHKLPDYYDGMIDTMMKSA